MRAVVVGAGLGGLACALRLQGAGYDVTVVELVPLEHTPKNLLIRAVRTSRPAPETRRLAGEYLELKRTLEIDPALERLLADRWPVDVS